MEYTTIVVGAPPHGPRPHSDGLNFESWHDLSFTAIGPSGFGAVSLQKHPSRFMPTNFIGDDFRAHAFAHV